MNAPGALVWNELQSPDLGRVGRLLRRAVRLGGGAVPGDGRRRYLAIENAGANNGGMRELSQPGAPPNWLVYFGTEDTGGGAGAGRRSWAAAKLAGPIDISMAKIGVVADPQGAVFALYAGAGA